MKTTVSKVYFIGIGGIGMSALARYFLSEGWKVSGSDISPSSITEELKKDGVTVYIGKQSANNLSGSPSTNSGTKNYISRAKSRGYPTLVVYNNAIQKTNPEMLAAEKLGVALRSYPEVIGELTKKYKTIALAGSHGKSTTTAMTTLILLEAGYDPTVIIGTKLKELGGRNFRKGNGGWLVLEADEWKAAFLNYHPFVATITNVDKEHLDFYKNFANVKKTFEEFKKLCQSVVERSKDPKLAAEIKKILKVPGDHNLSNALNAYAVAEYVGIPKVTILHALSKYEGAWRRMEYRGKLKVLSSKLEVNVYDDYGHHPSEIKATLAAFKQKWPKNPLICVFQAHQAHRLKALFPEFKGAFKAADKVILFPTYEVTGREQLTTGKKSTTDQLTSKLAQAIGAQYLRVPEELPALVRSIVKSYRSNVIVVMMGAGDIVNHTAQLLD